MTARVKENSRPGEGRERGLPLSRSNGQEGRDWTPEYATGREGKVDESEESEIVRERDARGF